MLATTTSLLTQHAHELLNTLDRKEHMPLKQHRKVIKKIDQPKSAHEKRHGMKNAS
jgi:hypothetical protein